MPKSKSDEWETPNVVFDMIFLHFGLRSKDMFDPCPISNTVNALSLEWQDVNYVNPPYSLLKEFVSKAIEQSKKQKIVIMLLPSKTDQQWFHDLIGIKHKIIFIKGRLKFRNAQYHATQPHFLIRI